MSAGHLESQVQDRSPTREVERHICVLHHARRELAVVEACIDDDIVLNRSREAGGLTVLKEPETQPLKPIAARVRISVQSE